MPSRARAAFICGPVIIEASTMMVRPSSSVVCGSADREDLKTPASLFLASSLAVPYSGEEFLV